VCTLLFPFSSVHAEGFENDDNVYINNVDDPVTVEEVQLEIEVFDIEDGDLTDEIYIVLDNYTGNEKVLGDFIVVYGATDSGGSEATIAIIIRNVDVTPPELIVEVESTLNIPQYSHLASNLPNIVAIDGLEGDLTSEIEITGLDLIDTEVLGTHSLIYSVSDSTGNNTTQTFIVNVVDSTPPELNGPTEFIKRANVILNGTFYMQYFSATDDHDGIVSNRIEVITDEYVGHANEPGTYEIQISVSDTQGNHTNHTLQIKVVKDMTPRLIIDDYYWVVDNTKLLKDDDFINILKQSGDLPNYSYIFTSTYDNYSTSYETENTYRKTFELLSSTGEEFSKDITLEVVPGNINVVLEEPSWISQNWKAVVGGVIGVVVLGLAIAGWKLG